MKLLRRFWRGMFGGPVKDPVAAGLSDCWAYLEFWKAPERRIWVMYGLRGLGVFNPPDRPEFIDPGYPPDGRIVAINTANNNAYQRELQVAVASDNYDDCELNAQNANSQAQYDATMARCRGQAAQQTGPEAGDLPTTYYTPGQPLSYTPGGPAITPPTYTVPTFAVNQPAFTPPVAVTLASPVVPPAKPPTPPAGSPGSPGSTTPPEKTPTFTLPDVDGFDFGSIPMWGWAAAGVAFLAFGQGGGRGR